MGVLGIDNRATVGLVVFAVFAASTVGQTLLERAFGARALVAGSIGLIAGMGLLALGLAVSSLPFLVAGGIVAGLGQGSSFRHGLAAINEVSPPQRRGEIASGFFAIAYLGISLPVVGVGLVAEMAGLRAAGLLFAAVVALLAAIVLAVLVGDRRRAPSVTRPIVSKTAYGTKGTEILPYAKREGIGVIVYSPMGSGLLTGRMSRERIERLPEDDWRKHDARFREPQLSRHLALVDRLAAVAARYGTTPGAVAAAWTLRNPAVDGAIVGFRRPDQVEPILAAVGLQLTDAEAAQIEGAQERRAA